MFNFHEFVRQVEYLQTVNVPELIRDFKVVDIRVMERAEGGTYLHFVNAEDQYLSTKIGKRVVLSESGSKMITEILDNYILYYGVSGKEFGEHKWLTWGPKPTSREPIASISISELLKQTGGKLAGSKV